MNTRFYFLFTIITFFLIAIGFSFPVFSAAPPATSSQDYSYLKVFYYRETEKGKESLKKNIKSIDVIAPQVYSVDESGELTGLLTNEFMTLSRTNGVKIMPLVTNGSFSRKVMADILKKPAIQDKIIANLIIEGVKKGYWGWQFDFEQVDADLKDEFTAFTARTYHWFKKNNLVLSVAVIAQHSDNPKDYKEGLWDKVIGVYDYEGLAKASDFISIMSYDDPASKGPVASYVWLNEVLKYSLKFIPPEKLSLGIPFYFWKWDEARGKIVDMGGFTRVDELLKSGTYLRQGWSDKHATPWVEYSQQGKIYTAWYENVDSFKKKLELVKTNRLHGFSAWVLGLEDPNIYKVLKTQ